MHNNISDFKIGEKYGGVYICKTHSIKLSKTGNQYIDMQINDKTGDLSCKCWNIPGNFNTEQIVDGDFIALVLVIEEYQGKMQAKIENIKIITPTDIFDKSEIIPVAPEPSNPQFLTLLITGWILTILLKQQYIPI